MRTGLASIEELQTVASRSVRAAWLTCLLACAPFGSALAQDICGTAWDGDGLAEYGRSFAASTPLRLKRSGGRSPAEITAGQILAFHEAKTVISRQLGRSPYLILCDGQEPNAFAIRDEDGDLVIVTLGMLQLADGDRDMAAEVMGHEVAHLVKNHAAASQARRELMEVLAPSMSATLYSKVWRRDGSRGLDLGLLGAELLSLSFDRDQEREADELGLHYLVQAGFSPQGAVRMAQRFEQLDRSDSGSYLSTHPSGQERGERLKRLIAASAAAQQALARTGPYTQLSLAVPGAANAQAQPAVLLPTYETTDAQHSYTQGMAALKRADYTTALREMRSAARAGYAPAQYMAGWLFTSDKSGVPRNDVEGVRLYTQAAEQGHDMAMNNLGVFYANGMSGLPKDPAEALRLYRKASELGNARALYNLADALYNGRLGLAKDQAAALPLYRQASERDLGEATTMLAVYHHKGLAGLATDDAQALHLARRAAQQGSADAQFNLGQMYAQGIDLPQDPREAARCFYMAATRGHLWAQVSLGLALLKGEGVPQDDALAARLFRAAADKGFSTAQVNLGYMYENGRGVSRDWVEALRWYRRAADQGNPTGQTNMGLAYAEGQGVPKDDAEAVRWFRLAAAQGFEYARNELKKRNLQ